MRSKALLATTATALLALTGCAHSSGVQHAHNATAACTPALTVGAAATALTHTAENFPASITPLQTTLVPATQRVVHHAATAEQVATAHTPAEPGSLVAARIAIYDGATGKQVYNSNFNGAAAQDFLAVQDPQDATALSRAVQCALPGDKISVVYSAADALPFVSQFGISAGSTAVALLDVSAVGATIAEGTPQRLPAGFPAVTRTAAGVPGVVIPPQGEPRELATAVAIRGTGREITASDNLVVRFTSVAWHSKEVLTTTWQPGAGPQLLPANAPDLPWRDSLNGIPVGSQVVVLQPASDTAEAAVIVVDLLLAG